MTITAAPGQVFSPGDWDALFAQHGRWSPGDSPPANVSPKPADEAYTPRDKTQPVYRYFLKDGTTVDARSSPDEQGWEIVKYTPSASFQQTQTAAGQAANRPTVGRVEGTPTGQSDPSGQPAYDNTRPIWVERDEAGKQVGAAKPLTADQREQWEREKNAGKTDAELRGASDTKPLEGYPGWSVRTTRTGNDTRTVFVNAQGVESPDPRPPADHPQVAPATLNTTSPNMATVMPDGSLRWAPNPNYQKPDPKPISLPPTTKWTIWQDPDGTTRTEKNPNYVPPSKIEYDQQTGRWIQVTEDDDGKPVIREVTPQTTIRPADIPVLQTKYGQVASSLGQLAQDLNGKAARGVITPQERDAAFKAAHEQATVAVDEMNTILGNSKAVWENEIQQRGQTFTEAANRRTYAGNVMSNAVSTGQHIAESAGPGHGRATALGVMTLMDMGQKYAQGMGGFPSMDPVAAPRALQQAASVGLPGFGDGPPSPAPGAPAGAPPPGPGAGPSSPFGAAVGNATATTRGLIDSALHPPGAAQRPALGPPPAIPGQSPTASDVTLAPPLGLAPPGGTPPMQTLPQQGSPPPLSLLGRGMGMGASGSPIGVPAFMGGGGAFDHRREGEAMLGASMTGGYGGAGVADPAWEEAVRRAMAMFG